MCEYQVTDSQVTITDQIWCEIGFDAAPRISLVNQNINDSIALLFTTRSLEDYGIILLSIENCPSPSYLLLLDEKENILRKIAFSNKELIEIKYLLPKKYILKIIHDKNNNDKWDTGNYLKNIQPEKVYYYDKEIIIKENWDMEITWDLEE